MFRRSQRIHFIEHVFSILLPDFYQCKFIPTNYLIKKEVLFGQTLENTITSTDYNIEKVYIYLFLPESSGKIS